MIKGMEASNMQHCPVCLGRVSSELFNSHMSSHSKVNPIHSNLFQFIPFYSNLFHSIPIYSISFHFISIKNIKIYQFISKYFKYYKIKQKRVICLNIPLDNIVTFRTLSFQLAVKKKYFLGKIF